MDSSTVKKIIEINKEFYQTFAEPFAVSRQRLQPGVRQILEQIEAPIKILDLGCGSGEVARFLLTKGFRGKYVGADFSNNLLEAAIKDNSNARYVETKQQAEAIYSNQDVQAIFIQADLSEPDWETKIPSLNYDCVFSFAVFHHIPGEKLRLQTLQKIHGLLQPEGLFWHSVWQFMNSARLRKRIQTWDQVNLHQNQVDPGDYLLDWRQGGVGYRYVHLYYPLELDQLAKQSGFSISESFFSDGEGNRLALYQKWQKSKNLSI